MAFSYLLVILPNSLNTLSFLSYPKLPKEPLGDVLKKTLWKKFSKSNKSCMKLSILNKVEVLRPCLVKPSTFTENTSKAISTHLQACTETFANNLRWRLPIRLCFLQFKHWIQVGDKDTLPLAWCISLPIILFDLRIIANLVTRLGVRVPPIASVGFESGNFRF